MSEFNQPKRAVELLAMGKYGEALAMIMGLPVLALAEFDARYEAWIADGQVAPSGEGWRVWLMQGGRGFGKTRAGAEWVHGLARARRCRIALVGATIDEARRVMVEGPSGVLAVARYRRTMVKWEPSQRRLTWPNGSTATLFSGEDGDGLRGPEHDFAWCAGDRRRMRRAVRRAAGACQPSGQSGGCKLLSRGGRRERGVGGTDRPARDRDRRGVALRYATHGNAGVDC